MFGKLVYGKFSLKETFWKFGVLGLFTLALIAKIFKSFLFQKIGNAGIVFYYAHRFSFLNMDNGVLFYTLGYFVFITALALYGIMVLFGVWRSAEEYDKSIWIRRIAKLMILIVFYGAFKFAF